MSVLSLLLIGLAMGVLFGVALEKSRVFEPGMIVGQMQLRNFIMLKVFLAAVATGLVALAVMTAAGWTGLHLKAVELLANVVGGLLLGAGITLAGACPGTVIAQVGAGYRDALAILAGGFAGALTFGYLQPDLKPVFAAEGPGKLSLADVTGLPFWAVALMAAALLVIAMFALERWRPWRDELGSDLDGNLSDGPRGTTAPADRAGHGVPAE